MVSAGLDPLRDEAAELVGRLSAAGAEVRHYEATAAVHGFLGLPAFARFGGLARLCPIVFDWLAQQIARAMPEVDGGVV